MTVDGILEVGDRIAYNGHICVVEGIKPYNMATTVAIIRPYGDQRVCIFSKLSLMSGVQYIPEKSDSTATVESLLLSLR